MSSVTSTNTSAASVAGQAASTTSTKTADDIQNRFLTLLVTQLKNQDPLNPMDNAQVTSQLSQINTVNGIEKLNITMGKLLDGYSNSQAMQAAGLIGKDVMVPGSVFPLQSGQALGGVSLSGAADLVNIDILDAAGKVVQTESLGAKAAGNFGFTWDGKTASGITAPDGNYTFKVTASQGGKTVTATALQIGTVSAVSRATSGFQLDLGRLGTVDFKNVQEIL